MTIAGLPSDGLEPVSAAPLFKAPFPCGQSWTASTYSGHSNNNNAVDFNLYPGQSDLGQPALADAPGTARSFWDDLGGNMVEIDHGGGWKTWYAHLATVSINNPIDTGEQVGTVGNTGTVSPHLHYEQRLNNVAQPVAFDGQRIPVGTTYTANDPKVTSTNCGPVTPPDRDSDGTPDTTDRCPDQPGPPNTNGCPDTDGDATADLDDTCPAMAGPSALKGCPESEINPVGAQGADFNADGKADYCRRVGGANLQNSYIACTLSTGTGFGQTIQSPVLDWGYDTGRAWTDFNADGKADYCRVVGDTSYQAVSCTLSTGTGFGKTIQSPKLDWGYDTGRAWTDFNADGKADYCRRVGGAYPQSRVTCTLSTGTGFGQTIQSPILDWGYDTGRAWVGRSMGSPGKPVMPGPRPQSPTPTGKTAGRVRIKVKAAHKRSWLAIAVHPKQTAIRLQVHRESRSGGWVVAKRMRVRPPEGSAVINVKAGRYRIFAPAQKGLRGDTSRTVRIRRYGGGPKWRRNWCLTRADWLPLRPH